MHGLSSSGNKADMASATPDRLKTQKPLPEQHQ